MLKGVTHHDVEEDNVVAVQLSAEVRGDLLLELLGSELKSLEWKKPWSGEGLEEVGYNMDFGGELSRS